MKAIFFSYFFQLKLCHVRKVQGTKMINITVLPILMFSLKIVH